MFGLRRKSDYSVVALARLAQARPPGWMSARELAEAEDLPLALLCGLLQQLQRAGLVTARRGVHGGYRLALPPERISLADVIRATEGPELVRLTNCCSPLEEEDSCHIEERCPITQGIRRLNRRLGGLLEQLTMQDLLAPNDSGAAAG